MNAEKLKRLAQMVRIGGKGTPRRKHKHLHRSHVDEKKVQAAFQMLSVTSMGCVEEVSLSMKDGSIRHILDPVAQGSSLANMHVFSGQVVDEPAAKLKERQKKTGQKPKVPSKTVSFGPQKEEQQEKAFKSKTDKQQKDGAEGEMQKSDLKTIPLATEAAWNRAIRKTPAPFLLSARGSNEKNEEYQNMLFFFQPLSLGSDGTSFSNQLESEDDSENTKPTSSDESSSNESDDSLI
ncbi:nascent polypeptide-associated complex subunit beta-like [Scaptodrosophila lebanonensis]|uniref:Transcription factor BTF3 n=1 Tax=Drosophila lebanonensis TaxID=7225 RepID=A0A6J2U4X4_DROLE|nr:nascent polypeptide-associated complex subunit beta-like [Scaptodrosophila lebanonensis]